MNHLLIVDDEKDLLDTLSDAFISVGNIVTRAMDGEEALEYFKHEDFDLAIIDVELPKKNGFDLTAEIKEINPQFPVILITGYSHLYRPQDVLSLDVEAFLKKPINIAELISIADRVISKKRTGLSKL